MNFHPDKYKILWINNFNYSLLQELPFYLCPYQLDSTILDYNHEEKDLGILTTSKFCFKAHQNYILSKAITQFNLLRRTCHYVNNTKKRCTLYITLIRSLFNHCSHIWKPVGSALVPLESLQKRCIKWINREGFKLYENKEYFSKLNNLKILTIDHFFLKNDLLLFYKIIHKLVPIRLPDDIIECNTRTRSRHNSKYLFQLHEILNTTKRTLSNSFFVRTMSELNRLPLEIRSVTELSSFRFELEEHLFKTMSRDSET